jgi:hypothetical protein
MCEMFPSGFNLKFQHEKIEIDFNNNERKKVSNF